MVESQLDALVRSHARYLGDGEALHASATLSELGIDSMAQVELLIELEDHFQLVVPDELLTPEAFETVGSVLQLFGRLRGGAVVSESQSS